MPSATPTLRRVDFSDVDQIVRVIEEDGGVIATNFTTPEVIAAVNAETKPWLDRDKPWKPGPGALFPPETRRCTRLVGRSKTVRESWLVDANLTKTTNHFLAKTTRNWYEDEHHTYTTWPVLSISLTMDVRAGAKGQRLHRDDKDWHVDHADRTDSGYRKGADVSMGCLVPGCEVSVENGATLVIPGSHLWDDERIPRRDEITYATMNVGEAFLFLGSTYHAGGTNSTTDKDRPMHGLFFCRGTHRAEENQYLAYPIEEVRKWTPEQQVRAGYDISSPNLGYVDFVSPMKYISGDYDPDTIEDLDIIDEKVVRKEQGRK